jgi:hypothetical protein
VEAIYDADEGSLQIKRLDVTSLNSFLAGPLHLIKEQIGQEGGDVVELEDC